MPCAPPAADSYSVVMLPKLVIATSGKNRFSDKQKEECGSSSVVLPHHFANGFNKGYQVSNRHALDIFLLILIVTVGPFQEPLFSSFKFLLTSWSGLQSVCCTGYHLHTA